MTHFQCYYLFLFTGSFIGSMVPIANCLSSSLMQNASIEEFPLIDYDETEMSAEDDFEDSESEEKLRWSYFAFLPYFGDRTCYRKCLRRGYPFARLVGTRCQCLCPINAAEWSLCPPNGGLNSCYIFCQRLGYFKGGGCLYEENCICFCGRKENYDPSIVYTTEGPGGPPTTSTSTTTTPFPPDISKIKPTAPK